MSFWEANKHHKRRCPFEKKGPSIPLKWKSILLTASQKAKGIQSSLIFNKKELLNPEYTKAFQVRVPISVWIWIECIMNVIYRRPDWLNAWSRVPFHSLLSFADYYCCPPTPLSLPISLTQSTCPWSVQLTLCDVCHHLCPCTLFWLFQVCSCIYVRPSV